MKRKITLMESVKVYDIKSGKPYPIFELEAGTEGEVESVVKAWKVWAKITLPDGREGLIPGETKVQEILAIPPKGGGWTNFLKVLSSPNPQQFGFDLPDCIQFYEKEIAETIRTSSDPSRVIVNCSKAGSDHVIQKEILGDEVIERLTKQAFKLEESSINALFVLEKVQKRKLISDALVKLLVEKALSEKTGIHDKNYFLSLLLAVELERQNGMLISDLLKTHLTIKDSGLYYVPLKRLWDLTLDKRIIDTLISHLNDPFMVMDKVKSTNWTSYYEKGIAWDSAEELLVIGDQRGIREIIPSLLNYMGGIINVPKIEKPLTEWVIKNGNIFLPDLIRGIDHKEEFARLFTVNCLLGIEDKEGWRAIIKLKDDPKRVVRDWVRILMENKLKNI